MTMDDIHVWHGTRSTDSLPPLCRYCNRHWEDKGATALDPDLDLNAPLDCATAINYELAGRTDSSHGFKDLRSAAKARKRHRERNEKYYSWRHVKPGDLRRPLYKPIHHAGVFYSTLLLEAPVETMTKAQLYREAQAPPRPPKLHRSKPWEKAPWGTAYRYSGPKHARQWLTKDVNDARGGEGMFLATGDDSHLYPMEKSFILLCDPCAEGTLGGDCCGCGCCLCHRECHEQQRRQREDAEMASPSTENGDYGWDLLSAPSSDADSEGEWDFAESNSEPDEE